MTVSSGREALSQSTPGAGWIAGARKPGEGRAAADGSGEKRHLPQQPGICEGGARDAGAGTAPVTDAISISCVALISNIIKKTTPWDFR